MVVGGFAMRFKIEFDVFPAGLLGKHQTPTVVTGGSLLGGSMVGEGQEEGQAAWQFADFISSCFSINKTTSSLLFTNNPILSRQKLHTSRGFTQQP